METPNSYQILDDLGLGVYRLPEVFIFRPSPTPDGSRPGIYPLGIDGTFSPLFSLSSICCSISHHTVNSTEELGPNFDYANRLQLMLLGKPTY